MGDPLQKQYGNGVLLRFDLDDFDAAVQRAQALPAEVTRLPAWSEHCQWECWLRDPDGYAVVLTSPFGLPAPAAG